MQVKKFRFLMSNFNNIYCCVWCSWRWDRLESNKFFLIFSQTYAPAIPRSHKIILTPEYNPAFRKIITTYLYCNRIRLKNPDPVFTQFSRRMCGYSMSIVQQNSELCILKYFYNFTFKFKQILFRQIYFLLILLNIDFECPSRPSKLAIVIADGPRDSIPIFERFIYEILL